MLNPILRKLRRTDSPQIVANLLEKHIGDGSIKYYCEQAYDALQLTHHEGIKTTARALKVVCRSGVQVEWCEIMKLVIHYLRHPLPPD
jgi:hypothetical protein